MLNEIRSYRKGRVLLLVFIGAAGYWSDGWAGVLAFEVLFGFGCFIVYAGIDFFSDVARALNQPRQVVVTHQTADTPTGPPDIEGQVVNRDPTIPDEEWVGAITYRINTRHQKGQS